MAYQEEDIHRRNFANIILKRPLFNDGVWQSRCTIGQGVQSSRSVGPSANWYQMASGICAFANYLPGKKSMELVLSEPNDFLQGEFMADPAHYVFSLEGMMFQRRYYMAHNYVELANRINENILQWWANIVLCAAKDCLPEQWQFAYAHQRTVFPIGGPTLIDYYWRRGLGKSHTGTGLATLGDRIAKNQAPYNGHLFADFFKEDLIRDVSVIMAAHRVGLHAAVSKFIKRGSRGVFHWVRLNHYGYVSLLENDIGIDEPRYVAMKQNGAATLQQHPAGVVGRFPREGKATIDMKSGQVKAADSVYGSFASTFDPHSVTLHVIASPMGVMSI